MAENENKKNAEVESGKNVDKKADKKNKKPNVFARMGKAIGRFFKECMSELKKVVWMSGKELRKSTVLVVVSVVVISIIIALIDYLFTLAIQGIAGLPLFN